MKQNVWEFIREEDGSYAVFRKGKLLCDSIPEKYLEKDLCRRFGFCGQECDEIVRQLKQSGRCLLEL
jgi:hypothetical protein